MFWPIDGINEARARCRLYVRPVTEDMLNHSVTVGVGRMHRSAFLSPLIDLFVGAVAAAVPTVEENVFVVGVRDDDEVRALEGGAPGTRVLNVSFSVRRATEYGGREVFYDARFLKERFYLQRSLMARLSTLDASRIHISLPLYLTRLYYISYLY